MDVTTSNAHAAHAAHASEARRQRPWRVRAAYHEAGHAVASVAAGARLLQVAVPDGRDGFCRYDPRTMPLAVRLDLRTQIAICLAGVEAERRLYRARGWTFTEPAPGDAYWASLYLPAGDLGEARQLIRDGVRRAAWHAQCEGRRLSDGWEARETVRLTGGARAMLADPAHWRTVEHLAMSLLAAPDRQAGLSGDVCHALLGNLLGDARTL